VPWGDWRTGHPETTILAPLQSAEERYKESTYGIDRARGDLLFPVEDYPPPGPTDPWARVVALLGEDGPRVRVVGPAGHLAREPGVPCVHAYWYAYHAARPDGGLPEKE
jgi:hypothetical protein